MQRGLDPERRSEWSKPSLEEQRSILNVVHDVDRTGTIPLVVSVFGPSPYLEIVRLSLQETYQEPLRVGTDPELAIFRQPDGMDSDGIPILAAHLILVSQYFNFPTPREVFGFYHQPNTPGTLYLPTVNILVERANLRLIARTIPDLITRPPQSFRMGQFRSS